MSASNWRRVTAICSSRRLSAAAARSSFDCGARPRRLCSAGGWDAAAGVDDGGALELDGAARGDELTASIRCLFDSTSDDARTTSFKVVRDDATSAFECAASDGVLVVDAHALLDAVRAWMVNGATVGSAVKLTLLLRAAVCVRVEVRAQE